MLLKCDPENWLRNSYLGGGLSSRNRLKDESAVYQPNIEHSWKRNVFQDAGMFDERFVKNQYNEFNLKTIYAGYQTLYALKVFFYYCAPSLGKDEMGTIP